jgi:Domain of unknown function (DUF4926)
MLRSREMTFKLLDTVATVRDIPEFGIKAGDVGVIVETFTDPEEAYEVEFCNANGETIATVSLLPSQMISRSVCQAA